MPAWFVTSADTWDWRCGPIFDWKSGVPCHVSGQRALPIRLGHEATNGLETGADDWNNIGPGYFANVEPQGWKAIIALQPRVVGWKMDRW